MNCTVEATPLSNVWINDRLLLSRQMSPVEPPVIPDPGHGWRLLNKGEPLQEGDGFWDKRLGLWVDFICRPDIFRGNDALDCPKQDFAHTWPWRRRTQPTAPNALKKAEV